MKRNPKLLKNICLLFLFLLPLAMHAQVNAGVYFSTFNLPGVSLRTNGFGATGQYESDKNTVFELSVGYFRKTMPTDSVSYLDATANTRYAQYNDHLSFYHFSADFVKYLAGTTSYKSKFAFYMGAGAGVLLRQTKTIYHTIPEQPAKESFTTFGFEYIIGMEAKIGFARVFVRGKLNFFIKYPVPIDDDTTIPVLTNAIGGILIPLIKHEKPHGRVVM